MKLMPYLEHGKDIRSKPHYFILTYFVVVTMRFDLDSGESLVQFLGC